MSTTPIAATQFLSTLGVNVHLEQGTADYGNLADVIADLNYLGINQVRDDITDGGGPLPLSSYTTLAQAGVHFDFISAVGGTLTTASLASIVSTIAAINAANPGSVIAVEGPNEINNFQMTYNGVGGTAGAVAFQQQLYTDVHTNANLAGTAVYYFTGYGYGGEAVGPDPATTSGLADFDNQHTGGGVPSQDADPASNFFNESSVGPGVYTEVAYSTNSMSQTAQAQDIIDFFLDASSYGVAKSYIYELMEEGDGNGLFNGTTPKLAATAIHNLTTILADSGTGGVTPTALNDTITGLPSAGHSLVMEKSTGVYDIALWNEATSGSSNVTVNLGSTYGTVTIEDLITGTTTTASNVSSVNVTLGQDPVIIQTTATTSPSPVAPPTALASSISVAENSTYTFALSNFNFSDSTPGDTLASVTIASLPTDGVLKDNGVAVTAGQVIAAANISSGELTFTPTSNATNAGSFTFDVTDSINNLTSTPAAMTIGITSSTPPAPPTALASSISVTENSTFTFQLSNFGFSDSAAGDTLAGVTIASLPTDGVIKDNGVAVTAGQTITAANISSGELTFTPKSHSTKAGSFTFDVTDSLDHLTSAPATMTIGITSNHHEHHGG